MAYKVVRGGTKRFGRLLLLCASLSIPNADVYGAEIYTKILECCKDLIESNVNATKRDIYYRDIGLFKSQRVVDLVCSCLPFHPTTAQFVELRCLVSGYRRLGLYFWRPKALSQLGTARQCRHHTDIARKSLKTKSQ